MRLIKQIPLTYEGGNLSEVILDYEFCFTKYFYQSVKHHYLTDGKTIENKTYSSLNLILGK